MKSTKINTGKREQVVPDLQGLGNQEPDMMNQMPDKNRRIFSEDEKNKVSKTGENKGKQSRKMPADKKGKQ